MTRSRSFCAMVAVLVGGAVLAQPGAELARAGGRDPPHRLLTWPPGSTTSTPRSRSRSRAGRSSTRPAHGSSRIRTRPPPAGFRLQPEVVWSWKVSADLKTYTFRLRRGFRFSDGKPVRASAFAHAINRVLQLGHQSPGADPHAGHRRRSATCLPDEATMARGVVARGDTLIVQVHAPGSRLPRADDASLLLRGPARTAGFERGHRRVPLGRPLLRRGVPRRTSGSSSGATPTTAAGGRCTSTAST